MPVQVADDPLTSVVQGAGRMLDDTALLAPRRLGVVAPSARLARVRVNPPR